MNKYLPRLFSFITISALILVTLPLQIAQAAASELFFSEYIEGTSFNKAVEIYNGTGAQVDLSTYTLELYSNGSATVTQSTALSGMLADGDVLVLAHASADAAILAVADDTNSSVINFNGDDAVVLRHNGVVVDVIGQVGIDPGSEWGTGLVSTADNTIRRKVDICSGDTNETDAFDPSVEWDGFATNTFDGLGSHTTNCGSGGGPTNPSGSGASNPSTVAPGDSSLLTISVTPGTNPASTGLVVSCDLSSIGGSATQTFFDDGSNGDGTGGDNIFSFNTTVDGGTSEGAKSLPCSITDTEARTGNASINLTVQLPLPPALLVINEILADPDATNGDANGDGVVNTTADEFVEIVNNDTTSLDISGWTLSDAVSVRHTFPANTVVPASCSVVVFASGTPTGAFGGSIVQVSSTGQLGLNNGGDTITLNNGTSDVTSYTYAGEGGDNQSLTRDPDVTGSEPLVKHTTATGSGGALQSPGTKVDGSQFSGCPGEKKIHEVQGSGSASPLVGQTVIVEGIVVGDFQDGANGTNGDFNGFHVQEEDIDADADPLTSEGIFVFDGNSPAVNVAIGDQVRVQGKVSEFNGLTELTSFTGVTVLSSGNPLPSAAVLSLPVTSVDAFEAYEGMRVTFPQALVISEYFNYDRFGEIVLTSERHLTPTAQFEPGPDSIQAAQDFLLDKITLDDGRSTQNPDPAIHPNGNNFDLTNLFRGGDTVANVTGVMDYSFSLYRIQPTQGADYISVNPRTAQPTDVGGSLKVSNFNVLNYFTTIDAGIFICGPAGNQECRGADDANELARQRAKIVAAMSAIDADILGLTEIENNTSDVTTADLVSGLNDVFGAGTYDYIATGAIGGDAIRVAIIYKPASVTPVGSYAVLDSTVDPRFVDTKNRPTLAQTFMENSTGGVFTVAINHLKSKGSDCNDLSDPDTGDGAGNCNLTRTTAAQALVDWLAADPTGSGDSDFLIIGDLNSYDKEDPIDAIKAGPDDIAGTSDDYTDLAFLYQGEDAYSYVFDGQTGYLDYSLASASLASQITGIADWHINADEPDLIDYDTTFKLPAQDAIYAPDAYRASDHDPVVTGLSLTVPPPPLPQCGGQDATVYVDDNGVIVGGLLNGQTYKGNLIGTNADDVIIGTERHNTIFALDGNDIVCALGGNDAIFGGDGDDTIYAGDGNDVVFGLDGDDTINGEDGKDSLFGGNGNDTLDGGADKDVVDGGLGNDTLSGSDGNDILRGDRGNDSLNGGAGADICNGGLGSDTSSSCEVKIQIP